MSDSRNRASSEELAVADSSVRHIACTAQGVRPRLLYVINVPWFFAMHRLTLALAARQAGYDVHVACGEGSGSEDITRVGLPLHSLSLQREGRNPWREAAAIAELVRLYQQLKPQIVHHVTLKPVIYGSVAARYAKVPAIMNSFAGLGYAFVANSAWARARRAALLSLLRVAFRTKNLTVTFENEDDRALMRAAGVITSHDAEVLPGVGVDVTEYLPSPEPAGTIRVLFAARMLKEKGVEDFVAAAQSIRSMGVAAEFLLVGRPDPSNPGSIDEQTLRNWHAAGHVRWLGFQSDMPGLIRDCHVVCLPTFYREGVPRILLEASACARPIVATSVAGCRDICVPGVSGILVEPRDVAGLCAAVLQLVHQPQLRRELGAGGRRLVEERFSLDIVLDRTLSIYRRLASPQPGGSSSSIDHC